MQPDRSEDLARGMALIPRRPEVMPDQADGRVRAIYEDVQRTLRVPFVNFIFRTLANDPDYLESAWGRWRPVLRTRAFERVADELRARALLEPVPDAAGVDWASFGGDAARVRAFTESVHYVLPKLLFVASAFDEDLGSSGSSQRRAAATAAGGAAALAEIPLGVAEGTDAVPMVDPAATTGRLRDLFAAIRERHGHPGVATYYRSLGHWPDLLGAIWERVAPYVGTASYEERRGLLIDAAGAAVHELAPAAGPPSEARPKDADQHRSVLAVFRFKVIPDLFLDVSLAQAMLGGGPEAARRSRFSAADTA